MVLTPTMMPALSYATRRNGYFERAASITNALSLSGTATLSPSARKSVIRATTSSASPNTLAYCPDPPLTSPKVNG